MATDAVKVAVRVRPFAQREIDQNAKLTIKMNGSMTTIINPEKKGDEKKFTFDYSFWSHDGYKADSKGVLEPKSAGSPYASQARVFKELGQGLLQNAFEGYNCSLFAYGQTGSGKSYSVVGFGANKGIVPIMCEELFKRIDSANDTNTHFEVTFSMLEIYNEQIRDLLISTKQKGGLNIRQHPVFGFYVQGLKKIPVGSYKDILQRTDQGTSNRTVAATNMNATSSRAHTVVTINFDQIIKSKEGETKKSSIINLIDLAGSERADSTGATGDRLKEGANINKSLSALGNVISALADQSTGKKTLVPYRDSTLTKLLSNALGGNSKTVMVAALSPADINYEESLSTLRYADRAKKIKNRAVINENPMDALVRELRLENERLRKQLLSGEFGEHEKIITKDMSPEEIEKIKRQIEADLRAQMESNKEAMASQDRAHWEKLLKDARAEAEVSSAQKKSDLTQPHLVNLNEDPLLSGVIIHQISLDKVTVGLPESKPTIPLRGLAILKNHAVLTGGGKKGKGSIKLALADKTAQIKVNGLLIKGSIDLQHKDRILFGSNHLYIFYNPINTKCDSKVPDKIDWEFAQQEIAEATGFGIDAKAGISKEQQNLNKLILEALPMVAEVNAVSVELNKKRSFELFLLSSQAQPTIFGQKSFTKLLVKMTDLSNENTWIWEIGKFINRRYCIQELYQKYLDGEDIGSIPEEDDPFWDPLEDIQIGCAHVFVQSLGYNLDFDDECNIIDYKGSEKGLIRINIQPCDNLGVPLPENDFVENAVELLKKPYNFQVTVRNLVLNETRFSCGIKVQYRVFRDEQIIETPMITDTIEPIFEHSHIFHFPVVTEDLLNYFDTGFITFEVYGKQRDSPSRKGQPAAKTSNAARKQSVQLSSDQKLSEIQIILARIRRAIRLMREISREPSALFPKFNTSKQFIVNYKGGRKLIESMKKKKKPTPSEYEMFFQAICETAK